MSNVDGIRLPGPTPHTTSGRDIHPCLSTGCGLQAHTPRCIEGHKAGMTETFVAAITLSSAGGPPDTGHSSVCLPVTDLGITEAP